MKILLSLLLHVSNIWLTYSCRGTECNRLVVDCDPGGDDAMALAILINAEKKSIIGPSKAIHSITTVNGNTGVANATRNVKVITETLNVCNMSVYRGTENPLARLIPPIWYYGYDGLGDFLPPAPPLDKSVLVTAPMHLAETIKNNPGKITVLFLGPLTNLALAVHIYPNFMKDVKQVFILGGSHQGTGNIESMPGVEANMHADPDAAAFFFQSLTGPGKVTLMPAETVLSLKYTMNFRKKVLGQAKNRIMSFLNKAERIALEKQEQLPGKHWDCYDQLTAGVIINPKIITETLEARVTVLSEGHRGFMVVDKFSVKPNAKIITAVDRDLFKKMLIDLLTGKDEETKTCSVYKQI